MSQQSELVEILAEFLRALDEPIHYKTLSDTLIEHGVWKPYGKQPDQIVYSAMHQDIKRRGEWSPFVFMGKGIFTFSDVEGVAEVEKPEIRNNTSQRDPAKRKGDLPHETRARREAMAEDAKCGNCAHIMFTGVEEYRMQRGLCEKWEISGRCSTSVCAEPCQAWTMRSIAQRETDSSRRNNLRIFMSKLGIIDPTTMRRK